MKLINLCPHPVCVQHASGETTTIPSSGNARVAVAAQAVGTVMVEGRPVAVVEGNYGAVTGLPDATPECAFIVSHMVRMALPTRHDLFSPADIVRDEQGGIVACRMFERNRGAAASMPDGKGVDD